MKIINLLKKFLLAEIDIFIQFVFSLTHFFPLVLQVTITLAFSEILIDLGYLLTLELISITHQSFLLTFEFHYLDQK